MFLFVSFIFFLFIYFYLFISLFFWGSSLSRTSRFALCTSHTFTDVSSPPPTFFSPISFLLMFLAVLLRLASVFDDLKHLFHPFKLHQQLGGILIACNQEKNLEQTNLENPSLSFCICLPTIP